MRGWEPYKRLRCRDLSGVVRSLASREKHHVTREQAAAQIAGELCISEATVKLHLANVYAKIGVRSRSEAVRTAHIDQWICLHDITTAECSNGSGGSGPTRTFHSSS